MYRSFLKCDDPKGVVGCGTIRKYRTRSHKVKDKTKMQKRSEIMETSLINKRYKEEKKVSKECDGNLVGPSSLQLTQVSREDHRDSWSRDIICEGKSEDIAKGTSKGALDLQDSLSMLRKLQEEATQHTTVPFGRKQTKKSERDRIDGNKIGTKGFQRPQPSAGGSSSHCKEELKKVIKESLVRQNMFPNTSEGFNSGSETFHLSTSQCSFDPSLSVIASKIERGPSLVFKLMGLEEGPSKSFPDAKQKLLGGEIDMSNVRKNDSTAEKVNPELKALRETLHTMHFKGIFKENFVKDSKLHVHHHFNDTSSKNSVDLSHISLTEPQCKIYQQSEKGAYIPVLPKELKKLRREILSSKTIKHRKGSSSTNLVKEMEKGIRKRLNKEEGPKFLRQVIKLDAKGSSSVAENSGEVKLYCHIGHASPVNETIDRKWKVPRIGRKQTEKDISQPTIVAEHQYKREIPSTKLRKLKSGSLIDKNEISCVNSRGSNNISTKKSTNFKALNVENKKVKSVADSLTGRKNQMKKQSPVAEPEPAKLTVEQIRQREKKKNYPEIRISTRLEDEPLMVCEADAFINNIGGKGKLRKSSSGDELIRVLKSEHKNDDINGYSIDGGEKEGAELKPFLLTNPSFIGHAKKLFNLDVDCPNTLKKDETIYSMANTRLYLDCAYELTERKSLKDSEVVRSLLVACGGNSRIRISLCRLVEEICDGIENLKFYREDYDCGEEDFEVNDTFAMMEKDMNLNGEINGTWESGWRTGFCSDETQLVLNKIESLLITGLIEDLVINLLA